jgi:hypothetical protein
MRLFLSILMVLATLTGRCFASGEQSQGADSQVQTAGPAPGDVHGKQKPSEEGTKKPSEEGTKKPAGGETEPDCE